MPQERQVRKNKGLTGLAKHGMTVSVAPARAASSHARKIFHERYRGRYRFARLLFVFDMVLVGIAATLMAFNLTLFIQSYRSTAPGLGLEFSSPPLVAADETPFVLKLRSMDGKTHDGVKVSWHLPPWIEVVDSNPRISSDGTVSIGTINPGQERLSRLLVRIRAKAGTKARIGFDVTQYDPLMFFIDYPGSVTRLVEKSALTVKPVFMDASYAPDASIPLVISNDGRMVARAVTLRLAARGGADKAGFGLADSFIIGEIEPGGKKMVFLDLNGASSQSVDADLDLHDAAQIVERLSLHIPIVNTVGAAVGKPRISDDGNLTFTYTTAGEAKAMVSCMDGSTVAVPYLMVSLEAATGTASVAPTDGNPFKNCRILAVDRTSGSDAVGRMSDAILGAAVPFEARVRYFSDTGDQLGVGPLPPRVGEKTTYWAMWSVGPFDQDLQNVKIETELPERVSATGKFASSVAGDFSVDGKKISWSFASLALAGQEKRVFAFEIEFWPTENDSGEPAILLGKSIMTAETDKDGIKLKTEAAGDDTDIKSDEEAQGRGAVE